MPEGDNGNRAFWQTMPGILTGVAGLLTAIATLIGVLVTTGVIGGGDNGAAAGPTTSITTTERETSEATNSETIPTLTSWARQVSGICRELESEFTSVSVAEPQTVEEARAQISLALFSHASQKVGESTQLVASLGAADCP